jgi:16S rRNA (guanine966-N2)-methyltransferase
VRIVGGKHRGRVLQAPPGDATRPTGDRARQALFNILEHGAFAAEGSVFARGPVLDVFAGTGALGLEALSRGARHAVFFEEAPVAVACLKANIAALGAAAEATIVAGDVRRPPPCRGLPAALVFLDPPYGKDLGPQALTALGRAGWLAPDALAILEIGAAEPGVAPEGYALLDQRRYGAARLLFLRRGEAAALPA